jgi:5-formyltetrahydrofolate cyclo-ligase
VKEETQRSDNTAEAKRLMRLEVQRCLRSLDTSDRARFSTVMIEHLEKSSHFQKARHVAIYLPLASEPDLLPLASNPQGKKFYAPRIFDQSLTFAPIPLEFTKLVVGPLGNREPDSAAEPIDQEVLDLVLVPGLAFDKQGHRLGRGRGCYDRWLSTVSPCALKIGVCFSCQMRQAVPCATHDVRMDAILNEQGLYESVGTKVS